MLDRLYEDNDRNTDKTVNIFRILLLTNRDSDNVGDQVIEACDISLVSCVMKNLGFKENEYLIDSRAAGIITKKYLQHREEKLLRNAIGVVKNSDLIIFGGAPLFNYDHQVFYERTAITLEIAEKFSIPVLFSAIGIEGYDENNPKCQRLKKTLNFSCVKQITTRDDIDSLRRFIENQSIAYDKVADPAVFSSKVFEKYASNTQRKKIGIFSFRSNGFTDNNIDFSSKEQARFWVNVITQLKEKKYDYEFLTSGHFSDEAFLDLLIRKYNVRLSKCTFNMNTPEKLAGRISSFDGILACRLHPSIIAYSFGVPSIGINWNPKIPWFYETIGYKNRVFNVENLDVNSVVSELEKAIQERVCQDEEYLMSVYRSLFKGIKGVVKAKEEINAYNYIELLDALPIFNGTTDEEYEQKLTRKMRRIYESYNKISVSPKKNKKGI